jgi:hypothetical protein
MVLLAAMLHDGSGVAQDNKAAARWLLKALRGGSDDAHKQVRTNTRVWSAEFKRELQRLMKEEGLYSGAIDGEFGLGFRAALDKLKPPKQ